eukprot:SAG22_NODE_2175_length_2886_cov_2.073197_3_plen_529_part_01
MTNCICIFVLMFQLVLNATLCGSVFTAGAQSCYAKRLLADMPTSMVSECDSNMTCSNEISVQHLDIPVDVTIGLALLNFSVVGAENMSATICIAAANGNRTGDNFCMDWPLAVEVQETLNTTDEDTGGAVETACGRGAPCQQCVAITNSLPNCIQIGIDCSCQCEAGFQKSAGAQGIDVCSECPDGTSKDNFGPQSCQACTAGTQSALNRQGCEQCAPGEYSSGLLCSPCTEGTHDHDSDPSTVCESENADSVGGRRSLQSDPTTVHFITADFASQMTNLLLSQNTSIATMSLSVSSQSGGTWSFVASPSAQFHVKWSDAHTRTASTQQNSRFFCEICAPGKETNAQRTQCLACDAGTYSDDGKPCRTCDSGFEPNAVRSGCDKCRKGKFSSAGDDQCRACPSGQYSDEGSVACSDCVGGRYDDDNLPDTPCAACPPGRYSVARQTMCESCSPGKADIDRDPSTVCEMCGSGNYTPPDAVVCTPCPQGQHDHDAGSYNHSASTGCVDCSAGQFSRAGSIVCDDCEQGSF